MDARRILVIQAHPDPDPARYGRALSASYADGARAASRELREVSLTGLDLPLLRSRQAWESGAVPAGPGSGRLKGRSARIVVTMGMPAWIYRWYFGAHAVKLLERNILRFVGIAPVRCSVIGGVESADPGRRTRWLARMRTLGERGQ